MFTCKVAELIQRTKNAYYHKRFEGTARKPRKMWELINDLSKNKIKESLGPEKLITDTGTITDGKEICEEFNSYFSSIGKTLASEIPSKYHNHRPLIVLPNSSQNSELHQFTPTTTDEISNTACGIDGINTKTVKCVKNLIVDELATCINNCLE